MKLKLQDLENIADEIGLPIDKVFCGYLRQPLTATKVNDHYLIGGYCAYNKGHCTKVINKDEPFSHERCLTYDNKKKS